MGAPPFGNGRGTVYGSITFLGQLTLRPVLVPRRAAAEWNFCLLGPLVFFLLLQTRSMAGRTSLGEGNRGAKVFSF